MKAIDCKADTTGKTFRDTNMTGPIKQDRNFDPAMLLGFTSKTSKNLPEFILFHGIKHEGTTRTCKTRTLRVTHASYVRDARRRGASGT